MQAQENHPQVKKKRFGGCFCCVPNCSNQRGKDYRTGNQRSYYSFPRDVQRRTLWLQNIRRGGGWVPRSWDRVCSDHFVGGKKCDIPGYDGYVPTLFSHRTSAPRKHSKILIAADSETLPDIAAGSDTLPNVAAGSEPLPKTNETWQHNEIIGHPDVSEVSTLDSRKRVNDITECSICNEIFTDPRVLPCIHTFCLECLIKRSEDQAVGDKLVCPLCTKEYLGLGVSDGAVASGAELIADLPKNIFVQKLVDARKRSRAWSAAQIVCDMCTLCSDRDADGKRIVSASVHKASVYCRECGLNMCEQCRLCHRRMETSSGHTVVELENRLPHRESLLKLPDNSCDKHPDKIQELFCFDCKLPTCTICFALCHREHACADIKVVAEEARPQMEGDLESVVNKTQECRALLGKLPEDKSRSDFCTKIEEAAKAVIETAERMKQSIDDYKDKLLKELESAKVDHEQKVESVRQELETSVMMLDVFKQYVEQMTRKGTPCDIATAASGIHGRAEELLKYKAGLRVASVSSDLMNIKFTSKFSSDDQMQSLLGELLIQNGEGLKLPTTEVVGTIPNRMSQPVTGLTTLDEEVFIACQQAENVEVYDAQSFVLKRLLAVGCTVRNEISLAACDRHKCIYMSVCRPSKICRIGPTGLGLKTWKPAKSPRGISTNSDAHLLVACCDANRIQEFTTDGELVREIVLQSGGTSSLHIMHAVQLSSDQFGITYRGSVPGFAVVGSDGHAIRSYGGPPWKTGNEQTLTPSGFTLDGRGDAFVVTDAGIFTLNLQTFCVSQLDDVSVFGYQGRRSKFPYCVHYDPSRRRLYIGERGGASRVLIVDVTQ